MTNLHRYSRQTVLPDIGPAGQARLAAASVLCVGAGGLGCPALMYLAAAGVGRIGIADFDAVEEHNLHRQPLFAMDQIGQNKAEAAADRLRALNPDITIDAYPVAVTEENILTLFEFYDVVIDATDNFAAKFLINDAALHLEKPYIYGAALGFEGQAAVFGAPGGPCYRCLFPHPPEHAVPDCAQAGILGATTGIVGAAQALEALKLILGTLPTLAGALWTIDTRTMETKRISLPKNPECPLCPKDSKMISIRSVSNKDACAPIPEITPAQAHTREDALLVDVREQHEWDAGHPENALHRPLSALSEGTDPALPQGRPLILLCQSGFRSVQAAHLLRARGYGDVYNLTGGYTAWMAAGLS